jgi:predicted ArsR family transcriptional regulator
MDTWTRLGPQPTRSDKPRDAALRVLRALVANGPATLADLAEKLGGHPNTTRVQVEHLVSEGFAREVPLALAPGRGRPARAYNATVSGRQVAVEDFERDDQGALVEAIAEHLADSPDPVAAAEALGRSWGRRLRHERGVVETLAGQGFTPEETDEGIALRTCPLLAAAMDRPEIVCAIHQGLIDAVSHEPMKLRPFALPGACLVSRLSDPHKVSPAADR